MDIDRDQMTSDGLMWLLQMGAIDTDVVKNALVLNIRESSVFIKDLEILTDLENRKMLVLLRLNLIGRWLAWFFGKGILIQALQILNSGLPHFKFRVIYDETLFQKAIEGSRRVAERRQVIPPRN